MSRALQELAFVYLMDRAPVFLVLADAAGRVVDASRYADTLAGRRLAGLPLADLFIDFDTAPCVQELVRDAETLHRMHVKTFTGIAQTLYFGWFDVEGQLAGIGHLDPTEVELMRKQLLSINQELHNRTRELAKANAELRGLDARRNQFLGMAAHDLRQPITAVRNAADLLLGGSDPLTAEQREFLGIVATAGAFMQRLIADFLDVSVIESGRLVLTQAPTDLAAVVECALTFTAPLAQLRRVTIVRDFAPDLAPVTIDAEKFEQVVANLVGNAIEHAPPGSAVRVIVRPAPPAQGGVTLAVSDEGPGVPPDQLERLFEPFVRLHERKPSGAKSTGLGLLIARRIVDAHGGSIRAENGAARGVTFTVALGAGTPEPGPGRVSPPATGA